MLVINFSALGNNKMEKKFIELVIMAEADDKVFFKVKNNKRTQEFNNGKICFEASNGIMLYSLACPSWATKNTLFVCGRDSRLDDMILTVSSDEFKKIQQAVEEYNKKFSLPQFIFRVSLDKIGTSIETTLNKLKQDTSWKEVVYDNFKFFAKGVLPVDAKYNIDCIQVNDKILFTEFMFTDDSNNSLKKARIVADIGGDDWTVYYLQHDIYEL